MSIWRFIIMLLFIMFICGQQQQQLLPIMPPIICESARHPKAARRASRATTWRSMLSGKAKLEGRLTRIVQ